MALNGKITKSKSLTGSLVKSLGSGGDPNPVVTHGTGENSILSVNPSSPNTASGTNSIAIGTGNNVTARGAIALGTLSEATAQNAIAIGNKIENQPANTATNLGAVAIGSSNTASGIYSVAIGRNNVTSEHSAVAIGYGNTASGRGSLAVNAMNEASAKFATSMGACSKAAGGASLVAGKYNIEDTGTITDQNTEARKYALIIGNGTADNARSNAATLDWDGNAVVAGKLTVGAAPTANMDAATKQYVDNAIQTVPSPASSGTPAMDGTASRGSSTQYARADHRHPTDTSRAAASEITRIDAALATKADAATMEQDIEDAVDNWLSVQVPSIGTLSYAAKQALLACFRKVAWIDNQGQTYYNALESELFPDATLSSITAVFTQGSTVIYTTDSLDTLRQNLVVTATYSDSTTAVVTDYTLSGTLTDGTSVITVSYGGKTDTFSVLVTLRYIITAASDNVFFGSNDITNAPSYHPNTNTNRISCLGENFTEYACEHGYKYELRVNGETYSTMQIAVSIWNTTAKTAVDNLTAGSTNDRQDLGWLNITNGIDIVPNQTINGASPAFIWLSIRRNTSNNNFANLTDIGTITITKVAI